MCVWSCRHGDHMTASLLQANAYFSEAAGHLKLPYPFIGNTSLSRNTCDSSGSQGIWWMWLRMSQLFREWLIRFVSLGHPSFCSYRRIVLHCTKLCPHSPVQRLIQNRPQLCVSTSFQWSFQSVTHWGSSHDLLTSTTPKAIIVRTCGLWLQETSQWVQ